MFWDIKSPFTASPLQVTTYLLGVALFSISFLVFLNSSVSFVITDLLGVRHGVGNAVGTLGFADELVALLACPIWGLLSDRIGVRGVTVIGYSIIGMSLFIFVQAKNIYPQLLVARLLFSVGGAATSTMVTAILPIMTLGKGKGRVESSEEPAEDSNTFDETSTHRSRSTTATSATVTPERYASSASSSLRSHPHSLTHIPSHDPAGDSSSKSGTSQIAGLVGMFTGIGALVALGLFLPLPARMREIFEDRAVAVMNSFYVVGSVALLVAVFCFFGLRDLSGEECKGWKRLFPIHPITTSKDADNSAEPSRVKFPLRKTRSAVVSFARLGFDASKLGFVDASIGLGYIGGFVARASSVAISLFIPLYINSYFISTGLCRSAPYDPSNPEAAPGNLKQQCERAYKLAAALTGVSQLIALLCAPLFGYIDGRYRRANLPILAAAAVGVLGYVALARIEDPDPESRSGGAIFAIMVALGFSQIGAIVCSLSSLGRGIQQETQDDYIVRNAALARRDRPDTIEEEGDDVDANTNEQSTLLGYSTCETEGEDPPRGQLKGSIAGIYSLGGGAGILLLTKLGGFLFDRVGQGAPFYLMALFNLILFVVALTNGIWQEVHSRRGE